MEWLAGDLSHQQSLAFCYRFLFPLIQSGLCHWQHERNAYCIIQCVQYHPPYAQGWWNVSDSSIIFFFHFRCGKYLECSHQRWRCFSRWNCWIAQMVRSVPWLVGHDWVWGWQQDSSLLGFGLFVFFSVKLFMVIVVYGRLLKIDIHHRNTMLMIILIND